MNLELKRIHRGSARNRSLQGAVSRLLVRHHHVLLDHRTAMMKGFEVEYHNEKL
jgi:hypothetical protein